MSSPILAFALRGAQIAFSAIVFGLSVSLVQGQVHGGAPISLGFSAFVGAASLVGAFIGIAANWVDAFEGIIGLGVDGFLALANLAGGVLLAVKLKAVDCSKTDVDGMEKIIPIDIVNAGCSVDKFRAKDLQCTQWLFDKPTVFNDRCRQNTADSAFMFLTLVVLLVVLTFAFLRSKR